MNPKRLVACVIVLFIAKFATDFLVHGVWLASTYKETASLWRSEAEMQTKMPWLLFSQFLFAAVFTVLWAKGFAGLRCPGCACAFGICMGLFSESNSLVMYAVEPLPGIIAGKWFAAGVAQGLILGLLAYVTYKPSMAPAAKADLPAA
jgi:hypothetical protein